MMPSCMISVIVPIYKVEQYLPKCIESIMDQTYRDLDIILINDGSPDRCGQICDYYSGLDKRIRVFHNKNKGLSAARNFGIEIAMSTSSDYIAFVDSDDWLEPDMYETLLTVAHKSNAKVVVCGRFTEFKDKTVKRFQKEILFSGKEALKSHICGYIRAGVWDKLWKKELFKNVRFPEGRVYEDIATVYKLFLNADNVACVPTPLYHYVKRSDSISQNKSIKNIIDLWMANIERYGYLTGFKEFCEDGLFFSELTNSCARAIMYAWRYAYISEKNRNEYKEHISAFQEMTCFACNTFPIFGRNEWTISFKVIMFLARFNNRFSLTIACLFTELCRIWRMNNRPYC